jgi:uncharacterized integral membrane protein
MYYFDYFLIVLLFFLIISYSNFGSIPLALQLCQMTSPLFIVMMKSLPAHALLQRLPSRIHRRLLRVHNVNDQLLRPVAISDMVRDFAGKDATRAMGDFESR